MEDKNDKEFEQMLQSTDEWGEVPNPSLLEEIDEELEAEAEISQYELLTKDEDKKRHLQAGFLTVFGLVLPFVAVIRGSEPLIMASLLVGTIILLFTGISYAKSKVYWNKQMTMSYEARQRRTILNGVFITALGGIELFIAVLIVTLGL